MTTARIRHIVGCMTGTSLDGIDVALVRIEGTGLDMTAHFEGMNSLPLAGVADTLRHFAEGNPAPPIDYLRAARQLGQLHVEAITKLLDTCDAGKQHPVDFVVTHGQTIWHQPADHLSWQLMDPWPIVRALRVPVCYDLRQADLIAGGQGAPITPIADWVMYRRHDKCRLIVNLGGICNVTRVSGRVEETTGGDIGPCNLLIDGVVQQLFPSQSFDENGRLAAQGAARDVIHQRMMKHPYFTKPAPCSTGREDFSMDWVRSLIADLSATQTPYDTVRSAVQAVATRIVEIQRDMRCDEIILAGGGAKNPVLVDAINKCCGKTALIRSDDLGIPNESREAMAFAVLGALSQDGVPITLPRVTGAKKPGVAGVWAYP